MIDPLQFVPRGMATGIGSLPFQDPLEALDLIISEFPKCPHWPQLPGRCREEHFVHQFLQPLMECGLLANRNDRWYFDMSSDTRADCLTVFYTSCLAAEAGDALALQCFLPSLQAAAGLHAFLVRAGSAEFLKNVDFVKGQIAGPLTVALGMKDEQGRPAYYDDDLRDVIVRTLALSARSQAAALSVLGRVPIIFVDDPAVSAFGSRLHLALSRENIVADLNFIFEAIRSEGAFAGVHSCEAIDWSLLTDSTADIISVDTFRFGTSLAPYAVQLRGFLERGGIIAWGITPTLDDPFAESVESLLHRLQLLWEELFSRGPDINYVLRRSMITPACGTGLLSPAQARQIYRLTAAVSASIGEMTQ